MSYIDEFTVAVVGGITGGWLISCLAVRLRDWRLHRRSKRIWDAIDRADGKAK